MAVTVAIWCVVVLMFLLWKCENELEQAKLRAASDTKQDADSQKTAEEVGWSQ